MGLYHSLARRFRRPATGGVSASPLALAEAPRRLTPGEVGDTGHAYAAVTTTKAIAKRLRTLETNYTLYESKGYDIYDRMRFSDPKVAGLLRAMRLPIIGAEVRIEPADPEDERAVEVADFVSDNLLHGMADSWRSTLYQFLLFLCHGHAPFEIVWKISDGRALIDRFAYRPPSTISDVYVEGGKIAYVHQTTTTGTSCDIPGEKLLWFVHEREGDNWRGVPLLRPMFKPWFAKEKLEILLLIAADRMNGVPVVIQPEDGWPLGSDGISLAPKIDAALKAFCVSDTSYFDFPAGTQFQLLTGGASIAELQALKASFDQDMSNVAIAQILDLGKTETGSRALGRTMSDMFLDSLTAIAADVEDTLNAPGGPIAQLVAYNFPAADELTPRLRFGSLSKLDLRTFAAGLYQCAQMGMPFGEETWEWIRAELDLPALKADAPSDQQDAPTPQEAPPADPAAAPKDGDEPDAGGAAALSESTYWRPLTRLESFVDLADVAARMDDGKAVVRERTQAVRDKLVAALVKRAQAAIATGDVAKVAAFSQTKPPLVDAIAAELRAIYAESFDAGRAQVADELDRQRRGEPVVDEATGERRGELTALAAPKKPTAKAEAAWLEWQEGMAEVTARQIAAATQASVTAQAVAALVAGMAAEKMAEMATRASDEAALKAGLTVTQVMLGGRSAEAQAEREQIAEGTYSAILDSGTCDTCSLRDGESSEDVEETLAWCPNPDCEGGIDRCRCMVIYSYRDGS